MYSKTSVQENWRRFEIITYESLFYITECH